MDRRDFIKKATVAAATAAVVSPVSAILGQQYGLLVAEDSCRRRCCSQARRTSAVHELYQIIINKND